MVITATSAQITPNAEYKATVQYFSTKDGLCHNAINGVYQDSRNLYWITTPYGLNRFDGHQFKLYTKEKNGIHSNILDIVYEDINLESTDNQSGMIWLLTGYSISSIWFTEDKAYQFSIFNPYTEQAIHAIDYLGEELYEHLTNLASYERKKDHLLFLTHTGYIIKYYHHDKVEISKLKEPLNNFFYYKKLSNQQYWAGFNEPAYKSLQLYSKDHQPIQKHQFCAIKHSCASPEECMGEAQFIPSNNHNDSIWFRSLDGTSVLKSIFCLLPTGNINSTPYHTLIPNLPKYQTLNIIYYDADNEFFWLTDNIATYIVHLERKLIFTLDFALKDVWLKDNQDLFWGSNKTGLFAIQFNEIPFQKHLEGSPVRGMVVDNQKRIWAYPNFIEGTNSSSDSLSFNFGAYLASHSIIKDEDSLIWSFCIRANQLWLGRFKDTEEGQSTLFPVNLRQNRIWSIYKDEETGLFWGGGESGLLFSYQPTTQKTTVVDQFNEIEAFKGATIYQIKPYGKQHFWLATSNGLYLMDKAKGIVSRYWNEGQGPYYLPADAIHHIHIDKDNTFWLGSRNAGLLQANISTSENAFHLQLKNRFTITESLPSNGIHAIYENLSPDGYLWLNTENGIVQFHKTTHFSTNFSTEDGIVHTEGNRIAHYQDNDGRIYFGTISGVTSFHPDDFSQQPNTEQSHIHLIGFDQYNASNQQIESRIAEFRESQRIVLRAKKGRVALTLSQPFTLGVKNVFYTYQIKGLHKKPIGLKKPIITISDVPYGKYTLELSVFNSKGDLLNRKKIPLISKSPFYLQWWFLVLLLTLGGVLAYLYSQYRTQQLVEQKAILEGEVRQRTQQLEADKIVIEQQAQKLKQLDETKSRFFANVSHELRTPIQLIQGPIQSILKMNILNNRGFTLLSKAEQNTKNLLKLVNEILDLTKLDAHKLTLNEEKIVFYAFLRRIVSNFQSMADAKSIRFTFIYQPKESLQIELDTDKFEKIINNLLTNALKFTPKNGKINIEVSDTSEASSTYFQVKVQDNGRGIPETEIPHIFNRFYQSSTNKKAEGGLGIGLALSMEFVKLMNGKMWAESNVSPPNQGTSFYFQFPKKEVMNMIEDNDLLAINSQPAAANRLPLTINTAQPTTDNSQLATILLVEDNHDLREYIQFLLAPYYHVITAENGQEALEQLTVGSKQLAENSGTLPIANYPLPTAHCQLIISDVMMPIMDGFEFLEKIKANDQWRTIPFIMLTARAALKDKLKALRIGVDDYILKPFKEEELVVRIENLLTNAEERTAFIQAQDIATTKDSTPQTSDNLSQKESEWLEKVGQLVLQHLTDNRFSVDFLAELLNINRKTLYQKIKALTGLTPNQYTRVIRLRYAKEQLEQGQYTSVKAAANAVGFSRPDYFSKLFLKEFGKTPMDYL